MIEDDTIVIKKAKIKSIEELFAEFDGEYISEDIDWGKPEGIEVW